MSRKLDDIDKDILKLLEKNAKMPINLLASKLYQPSSTIHHRIKSLEKAGIIRKWTIEKDYSKMGLPVKAYLLIKVGGDGLHGGSKTLAAILSEVASVQGVENAEHLAADYDIIACVRAPSLSELKHSIVHRIKDVKGVQSVSVLVAAGQ